MGFPWIPCYFRIFRFVDKAPAIFASPQDNEAEINSYAGNYVDIWDLSNAFSRETKAGFEKFGKYFKRTRPLNNLYIQKSCQKYKGAAISNEFLTKLPRDYLTQDWREEIFFQIFQFLFCH